MENILFEHNQRAYEAAVEMMEATGRAAVIHPTGTGKSFIAFKLCADHEKESICWLSPSEYIFATQEEKWRQAGGITLENIEFFTYAKLMRRKEKGDGEEFLEQKPSYIILDEFHRLGAAQWGGGVEWLRSKYPQAKVLGLSATNIRYLDNQRDMAWELFGGNIASELTLGAAIAGGILPAPKYVLSVYSYQKELERYQARIKRTKNRAVREKAQEELQALRRALGKADGLKEVFARHMLVKAAEKDINTVKFADVTTENREVSCQKLDYKKEKVLPKNDLYGEEIDIGKYIVFCANYNHLNEMKALASEWFSKVDQAPHIYTAYSNDPGTLQEFEAFKVDRSPHLKLLYCIDMLNEGIHVDGVDGVILLRPTVSPTIYKQQVGRALATGGKKVPVIFDIVMNIENLCSIGAIEEELREAVFALRATGRQKEIVNLHFRVVDELGDCRRLFAQLNETLTASWDAMYWMARKYYETYGNLEIPAAYMTADGYSVGAWVATQRKVYRGKTSGCLNEEQVKRLEEIGMCWQGIQEATWERNFIEAEKYFKEYGNLAVPADYVTVKGCRLGRWVRRQREIFMRQKEEQCGSRDLDSIKKSGENIHEEHIRKLTGIGMVWERNDPWERRFEMAKKYYEEHGNLRMAADYVVDGVWLGRWVREQKVRWKAESGKKTLTQNQKEKLALIGMVPGVSQSELSWCEQYGEAKEFYKKHGNLSVPKWYITKNGKNLAIWLKHQRTGRRNGLLSGWQVAMLDELGMVWELPDSFELGLMHAREYFRENGHLAVPNHYICADGYRLGKWISNQRYAYSRTKQKGLTKEQIWQLEITGMVWSVKPGRCRKNSDDKKNREKNTPLFCKRI